MIQLSDLGQVYLVCGETYRWQRIDSLVYLVKSSLELDLFSGQGLLFCGGRIRFTWYLLDILEKNFRSYNEYKSTDVIGDDGFIL